MREDEGRMGVKRRMGPPNSASRDLIFDAVERVLQKEGTVGLTARRVAEEAGFNHQTVYYYFQTMEELILGAFRRRSENSLRRMEAALASDRPLHAIWGLYSDASNGRLNIEFNALAMRNAALRSEIIDYLERSRTMQEAALAPLLEARGLPEAVRPIVPGMLVLFVANFLDREAALGVTKGHAEMEAFVDWCLGRFELAPSETAARRA
jgi:AcrR family transcriptional regulator